MTTYKVTCKKCKSSGRLVMQDKQVTYKDHTPIISSRYRGDLQWGFECICGNDSRLCREELNQSEMLIKGSTPQTVKAVVDNIKLTPDDSFIMEKI